MDYQDDFQERIARYNRELMRAYQKRQREREPVPDGEAPPVAAVSVPVSADGREDTPAARGDGAADTAAELPAETQPRYPLFRAGEAAPEADVPVEFGVAKAAAAETPFAAAPSVTLSPADGVADGVGYLQVWTTTAREAVPVAGAHITVTREVDGQEAIDFIGETDRSGRTAWVPLAAAGAALSQSPDATVPTYTPYNVAVYAAGYYRVENRGLPMYSGVKAVWPVRLIPLPEYGQASDTLRYPDSAPTALSQEGGRMA